jgi:DNA replication protein DnaC
MTTDEALDRSEEIRRAALERARVERGHRPTIAPGTITEYGLRLGADNAARRAENREREAEREARMAGNARRIDSVRALSWIDEQYADATLSEPAVTAWADDALNGDASWLVLIGPVGVGKTWQAVGAYRALVEYLGGSAVAVRVPDLLARSLPSAPDPVNVGQLERADLLLLDDLPVKLTEWEHKVLFRIVDARAANRRRTIVTTNLRRDQVRSALGDRLASRLSQYARVVVLAGPDRRTPAGD